MAALIRGDTFELPSADRPAAARRPELELARFGRRANAATIDAAFVLGVVVGGTLLLGQLLSLSGEDWYWFGFAIGATVLVTFPLFVAVMVPVAFAAAARAAQGRTPGKALRGVAIRCDAAPDRCPGLARLFRREGVRGLLISLFLVPALLDHLGALRDPCRQTLHDRAAGTIVVDRRAQPRTRAFLVSAAVFSVVLFAELAAGDAIIVSAL